MSADALSSDTLAGLGVASSPTAGLKTPYEAVALFSHACMLAIGFRLIGFGEDEKLDSAIDGSSPSPLPAQALTGSSFSFRYAHAQSSMEFIVKVSRLGHKAVIFGIALGDDKTTSFDIVVKDYLSESAFPLSPTEDGLSKQKLIDAFISTSRIQDLAKLFRINIIQKLAPGLAKDGYTEDASEDTARSSTGPSNVPSRRRDPLAEDPLPQPARPRPFDDPLAYEPRRPYPAGDFPPPGFEDEYEINRPPRGGIPGFNPMGIGADDLNPPGLGLQDPLRIGGPRGPGAGGPHRGMHPTFDDPMFGGGGVGRGRDSRAPPGARYDPVNPEDDTPMGHPGFPGGSRGGPRGGPPNPFSGFGSGDFI